jgi:hypothetical protein
VSLKNMEKNRGTNQANRRRRLLVNLLVLIIILGLGETVDAGSICTMDEASAEINYVRTWGCYKTGHCFCLSDGECKNEILINVDVKNTGTKTCWYKADVYTTGGSHIYDIGNTDIESGDSETFTRDTAGDLTVSTNEFSDRYVAKVFVCTKPKELFGVQVGCDYWQVIAHKTVCCGACSCDKDGQHGVDCVGGCEASCECDGEYPGGSVCGSNCYPVGETPPTPIQPCSQGVCESKNTFPPACKCGDPGGEETEDGKRFCCASHGKVFADKASCDELCITPASSTTTTTISPGKIEYSNTYQGCGDITYEEDCDCVGCCCCDNPDCRMECEWRSRIEQKTDLIDIPRTVVQHITIPKVSHEDILDNTRITVTEVIDQYVDEWGGRSIYGILNVTLEPDILSEFLYVVND